MANTRAEITRHPDGTTTMLNFMVQDSGALVRREADMNAVVVQMIEAPQEDGTMGYRRIVSVVCKDQHLLPVLMEQARIIAG